MQEAARLPPRGSSLLSRALAGCGVLPLPTLPHVSPSPPSSAHPCQLHLEVSHLGLLGGDVGEALGRQRRGGGIEGPGRGGKGNRSS